MIRNYLRIAYRNLTKNKVYSLLNICGLAVGIAAFLFIIQYVRFERSYEDFHENADNIYRVTLDLYNGTEFVVTDCETYPPVGPMLKEKMPEVLEYVRMFHNDGLQDIEVANRKFLEEGIYFADQSAFTVFTLPVINGDSRNALVDPFSIVLSESSAYKYFGNSDVIGESVKIGKQLYKVTAVIKDLPPNTHLKFNAMLSHSSLPKLEGWYEEDSWNGNNEYTYLLMAPETDLNQFNAKLVAFVRDLKDKIRDEMLVAEPVRDIHLYSNKSFEPEVNGSARVVYFLLVIAIFIIVIAWVNYVNLATARAVERAKEVGIRKVMGSLRRQLIFQFLSESAMINALAGLLAFVIFQTGLPYFRDLSGAPLPLDFIGDPQFWNLLLGLLAVGTILSGIYPAFVLSSFQPSTVLKGKFRSSPHGHQLRRMLVVFQFASTVIIMVGMVAVYLQLNFLRSSDLGMDLNQTLVVRSPLLDVSDSLSNVQYQRFKTVLGRNSDVVQVSASEIVPGLSLHELSTTSNIKRVGHEEDGGSYNYYYIAVDPAFIPTMDMELVGGHGFEEGGKNYDQVIINEEAVKRLGFSSVEESLGARITFRTRWKGEPAEIIGVLKDFYQRSPKEQQIPMILRCYDGAGYFSVKLSTADMREAVASVKRDWDSVFPNSVFHYFFLDEQYDQQYQADARFGRVVAAFSCLAVLVACLGLFGLSSFTIVQRTKEIGIRKVLGASVSQIVRLLSKDFAKVVFAAAIVALPIAYYAIEEWLSGYASRIQLNGWIFAGPVMCIMFIAMFTVSFQTLKTALKNPANSLKQE